MTSARKQRREEAAGWRTLFLAAVIAILPLASTSAKTLIYCSEASPDTFDPALGASDSTMDASAKTIYNRLVEFKPGTTEVGPSLAESWDVDPDGTVYTFHLRSGVKFQTTETFKPSRPLDADDVISSFERQWKADNPFHGIVKSKSYEYFDAFGLSDLLKSIDKIDDHTVRFTLTAPNTTFLAIMAEDFASILSLEYSEEMLKAGTPLLIGQAPVGTGPFMFRSYAPDSVIRYRANPDYWDGEPKIDLTFAITPDPQVRVAKLQSGECHVSILPPRQELDRLAADPTIDLLSRPGQNIGYVGLNVEKPPLNDVRVRRAIAMAIDKGAVVKEAFGPSGTVAQTFIPPGELGYDPAFKGLAEDKQKAKALLAEAGFPGGFDLSFWIGTATRGYQPNSKQEAEIIQADLAAVGIKANVVSLEWGTFLDKTKAGEQQAFMLGGTTDNGDPDNLATYFLSCAGAHNGSNRSRWCNPDYEKLIGEARQINDLDKRRALYLQAQAIVRDEAPIIPLANSVLYMPTRKEVTGYVLDAFGRQNFAKVDLK